MKDYYKVLGVEPGADVALIKSAYRKLARQFHPDLHPGDKAAEERFKDIGEAWEVLGDSQKREKYDADRLKVHSRRPGANKRPPKADYADIMQQFDSFFGKAPAASGSAGKNPLDGSNLFNSFMGKGMGKKK